MCLTLYGVFGHFVVGDGHKDVSRMNFSFFDYNLFQAPRNEGRPRSDTL